VSAIYGIPDPTPEQIASEERRKAWCARMKVALATGLSEQSARQTAEKLSHGRFTGAVLGEIADLMVRVPRRGDW